jgi:hypothetical protein
MTSILYHYIQHPAMKTSDIKPLFSRIPYLRGRDAQLHDCAWGLALLTHASECYFGQNVRVTKEWSTGVFRLQACEFRKRKERQMFIALRGLSLSLFWYRLNDLSRYWTSCPGASDRFTKHFPFPENILSSKFFEGL